MPFGGELFQGGDVNAGAMGGGTNGGAYSGLYPQGGKATMYGSETDPAYQARQDANFSMSNTQSSPDTSGANTDAQMGRAGGGLALQAYSLFNPRQTAQNESQRVYSRAEAQYGVSQAHRNYEQYQQDAARQEQQLMQSFSGRGLGESSIKSEGMQYFHDTEARQMDQMRQQIAVAEDHRRLVNSQISNSYQQPYLSMLSGVIGAFAGFL